MNAKNEWTLFSRKNCHLCWAMEKRLKEILKNEHLNVVDIDLPENAPFFEKYNWLVPVLLYNEKELCHYHLDEAALFSLIEKKH